MNARASLLAALAIALASTFGLAVREAGAQPFGRGGGFRAAEHGRGGRGGGEYRQPYREPGYGAQRGYRPEPRAYAPPPRTYAYPPPAYPYAQRGAPPGYAPPPSYAPPAYGYAPPAPGRNSLGAYWGQQQDDARRGVRQGNVPLGSVLANIRRITPGRILDAGIEPGPDGRPAYRVRWAARGGRRIDYIVDAATGAIIGQSGY